MSGLARHNRWAAQPIEPWLFSSVALTDIPFTLASSADFPVVLRDASPPVAALWYRGRLPGATPALAVVGARGASRAGCRRTQELAEMASHHGYAIVSGGALGIDAAAHQGALAAGGPTFAVLGCGVDVVYPDRHGPLFAEIAGTAGCGLLSEFPPGTPPRGRQFPSRNRIVAALAEAVVVVEAQARSGALVTARLAHEINRPLYAVPGSPGTDALLAAGWAQPVRGGAELLAALAGEPVPGEPPPAELEPLLAAANDGATAVELARRLAMSLPATLALLSEGELGGWILKGAGGVFTRTGVTRGN